MKYNKNYYQILGVEPNASEMEIRRAYRRLAIFTHPDRNPTPEATTRMQEINEAYGVIGNKNRRRKYDSARGEAIGKARTKDSPQSEDSPKTPDLQHVFAEDATPSVSFLSTIVISAFSAISASFFCWSLTTLNLEFIIPAAAAGITGALSIYGILAVWRNYKSGEIEAQCPKCNNLWAAEKLGEKITGVFPKKPFALWSLPRITHGQFEWYDSEEPESVPYERYKVRYKCKYCGYEWAFLGSRRR